MAIGVQGTGRSPHEYPSPETWFLEDALGFRDEGAYVVERRELLRAGLDERLGGRLLPQRQLELRDVHAQEELCLLRPRLLRLHDLRQHLRRLAASSGAVALWQARSGTAMRAACCSMARCTPWDRRWVRTPRIAGRRLSCHATATGVTACCRQRVRH